MLPRFLLIVLSAANIVLWRALSKFQVEPSYFPDILCALLQIALLFEFGEMTSLTELELKTGRKILRRLTQWIAAVVFASILLLAVKLPWFLSFQPPGESEPAFRVDLLSRRSYLVDAVATPQFSEASMPYLMTSVMQKEWMIGTLSMTTSALTNIAFRYPETRPSAIEAIGRLLERMLQPDVREFEKFWWGHDPLESLDTDDGSIGYLGHLNLMIGAYRILGGDTKYQALHDQITSALARRIENKPFPYLETFPNQIFTADNAVVAASIALYDRVTNADHSSLLKRWIEYTAANLIDPESGGIVFYTDMIGKPFGETRGSAAGWFSFYLPMIDESFARSQFASLERSLQMNILPPDWFGGFSAIREYLPGRNGPADIDSGPVVFGMSTSGTGFSVAGATRWNSPVLVRGLLNTAELVGSTLEWKGRRCYLLAPLIGDAIMLAMKTSTEWDRRFLGDIPPSSV